MRYGVDVFRSWADLCEFLSVEDQESVRNFVTRHGVAIDELDAEVVERWYQEWLLQPAAATGNSDFLRMIHDMAVVLVIAGLAYVVIAWVATSI